jgi:VRR-NUC domain
MAERARIQRRPEAALEREVLLELGRTPWLLIAKNEVAKGFQASLLPALHIALAPFGPAAVAAAISATQRHRAVFGLGVGSPDLVMSAAGQAGGIELKAADGRLSPDQERWRDAARRRGMFVAEARTVAEAVAAAARCRKGCVE